MQLKGVQGHGHKRPTTHSSAPLTDPRCYLVAQLYVGEKLVLLKDNTTNTFCIRQHFMQYYADLLKMSKMMLRMLIFVGLSTLFYLRPFHALIIKYNWSSVLWMILLSEDINILCEKVQCWETMQQLHIGSANSFHKNNTSWSWQVVCGRNIF